MTLRIETMTNKIQISAESGAPPDAGTYSHAIRTGNLIFVTGQTGRNPDTSKLEDGLEAQTLRAFSNITSVLDAASCTPNDIVKSLLIVSDLANFPAVNEMYENWLRDHQVECKPTRTSFQAGLPHEALVMLDVIAAPSS